MPGAKVLDVEDVVVEKDWIADELVEEKIVELVDVATVVFVPEPCSPLNE